MAQRHSRAQMKSPQATAIDALQVVAHTLHHDCCRWSAKTLQFEAFEYGHDMSRCDRYAAQGWKQVTPRQMVRQARQQAFAHMQNALLGMLDVPRHDSKHSRRCKFSLSMLYVLIALELPADVGYGLN